MAEKAALSESHAKNIKQQAASFQAKLTYTSPDIQLTRSRILKLKEQMQMVKESFPGMKKLDIFG